MRSIDATVTRCLNPLRVQRRALANRLAARLPERTVVADYLGYRFAYPSRSAIGRAVASGLTWDAPLGPLVERLPPGGVVCDVGANLGASLLTMCRSRDDLRFVCFEPSPRYAPYLIENVRTNELEARVGVEQTMLGPEATTWMLISDVTSGSVATDNSLRSRVVAKTEVRSSSLDGWFCDRQAPAMIKVDTDGFELRILTSGTEVLAAARPHLFLELCPELLAQVGDSADDLLTFLARLGYETADLFSPAGQLIAASVPLTKVTTGVYPYLDMAIAGKTTAS